MYYFSFIGCVVLLVSLSLLTRLTSADVVVDYGAGPWGPFNGTCDSALLYKLRSNQKTLILNAESKCDSAFQNLALGSKSLWRPPEYDDKIRTDLKETMCIQLGFLPLLYVC